VGRNKQFDPDEVLDAALDLFWRRGYEATSTADLVTETGIARGSLYATFHSKHELYLRTLDRYVRAHFWTLFTMLRPRSDPLLPAVRTLVETYATAATSGCYVVNAAVERMGDDEVARMVRLSWNNLEGTLTTALLLARDRGELPADAEPEALARFLMVFLQGVRVVGVDKQNHERLADAVRMALKILD
jgi:TetR/AcrR family transcriptional repressor of nem operon